MKGQVLTEQERMELYQLHRQQGYDSKAADKIKTILMLDKGYTQQEIAEVLLRDEDTITRWKKTYQSRKSLMDWIDDEYTGYSGKLTAEQLAQVDKFVQANLIQSANEVLQYIVDRFGIRYSLSGVQELLHRLDFVYKQTTHYPSKLNPEDQEWFKKLYELVEKELLDEDTAIVFVDGVHPQHNTQHTRVWTKKGESKFVPANTGREHLNLNGAYNPHTAEVVIHEAETINAETTIELFQKILEHYQGKKRIIAICDNARYYRSHKVREFVHDTPIQLRFLPPYSPNLNLIERLWKLMKKKVINLCYYPTFKEFREAVLGFFENFNDYKDEAKRFIGTKMRLIQPLPA
jgi:transposase